MKLIIGNKSIITPIVDILKKIQQITHREFLKDIKPLTNGRWCMVTCPIHAGHNEQHPSCGVMVDEDDSEYELGFFHCFTCGNTGSFVELIALCLDVSVESATEWLLFNYGNVLVEETVYLEDIVVDGKTKLLTTNYYDESELDKYNWYNEYILNRGITPEVVAKYKIGYDPVSRCVTFPLWDERGNLVAINKRSVDSKKFILDPSRFKAVYLLNYAIKENAKTLYITESQINALTLMSYFDVHAVALCGTGSQHQYDILKKCGIRNYILCLDPDDAGKKGVKRFIQNMSDDVFVTSIEFPEGKDVNDLSKDELISVFKKYNISLVCK